MEQKEALIMKRYRVEHETRLSNWQPKGHAAIPEEIIIRRFHFRRIYQNKGMLESLIEI